jgi:hypothetical protein
MSTFGGNPFVGAPPEAESNPPMTHPPPSMNHPPPSFATFKNLPGIITNLILCIDESSNMSYNES